MGLLNARTALMMALGLLLLTVVYQCGLSLSLYLDGIRGLEGIKHRDSPILHGSPTRIPKKLHQTWKNEDLSTYPLNATFRNWKQALPGFEVRLWTDKDVEDLVRTEYPFLLPTYLGYRFNIQRADIARYVILHHEGGIYADLDCGPSRLPVSQLLNAQLVVVATWKEQGLSNHFMAAERGSPILEKALVDAPKHDRWIALPYLRVFASTGPLFITKIIREYQQNNREEETDLLVLGSGQGMGYCFHNAGRSWHMLDGVILNYIVDNPAAPGYLALLSLLCLSCCVFILVARRRGLQKPPLPCL